MIKTAVFLAVIFAANVIQAITGFAGTLLAMPVSVSLIGVHEAKVILNIMAFLSCLGIVVRDRKNIRYDILLKIIVLMGGGMAVGIWIFKAVPLKAVLPAYGIMIIMIACKNLMIRRTIKVKEWVLVIVLIMAGVMHGMFVSGGALLVIYASAVLKDKDEFRVTVAHVWVILNIFLMLSDFKNGYITPHVLWLTGVSIIPLILALYLGSRLHETLDEKLFLKLTNVLLLISGVSILL